MKSAIKFLILCVFFVCSGVVLGQGITHVQIDGPSTANTTSYTTFTVSFWNGSTQVTPQGYPYVWNYPGAVESFSGETSISLIFTSGGSKTISYTYYGFDDIYYASKTVSVSTNFCAGVTPGSDNVARLGAGSVTLVAHQAPPGFTYRWYASNQTTVLASSQSFTTPVLSSNTTYYLGYLHVASGCVSAKVPFQATIQPFNSVRKMKIRQPITTESSLPNSTQGQSYKEKTYFDGLGRPNQSVKIQAGASNNDILVPMVYDAAGRDFRTYLPYPRSAVNGDGVFSNTALTDQSTYYNNRFSDTFGYSEKLYEASPTGRVLKQSSPGNAWKMGTGKELKFDERPNVAGDGVRIFTVNSSGLPVTSTTYAETTLWTKISNDEDDRRIFEFTDKEGKTILKKVQLGSSDTSAVHTDWLWTYYVYDVFGRLRVVIPPQAVSVLNAKGYDKSTNTDLAAEQYFLYKYDARGRMIEKQVPGKKWEHMVYDLQDRLVGYQDGEMRAVGTWLYTKYDALGREIMTGITSTSDTRVTVQNAVNAAQANNGSLNANSSRIRTGTTITSNKYDGYESYKASTSITLQPGFVFKASGNKSFAASIGTETSGTVASWPALEGEILTVTYYDNYQLLSGFAYEAPAGLTGYHEKSDQTHGLMTGKKVKDLGSSIFMTQVLYYDKHGRVIQEIAENHVGGLSRSSTKYDFENRPIETHVALTGMSSSQVLRGYTYHAAGPLRHISHKLNSGTPVNLAVHSYNDLGELIGKKFPMAENTYAYNIRGWLTNIGSPTTGLFKEVLHYNTGTNPQWNGNINRMDWWDRNGIERRYAYVYDKASRITTATYSVPTLSAENNRYNLSGISYDANGNIKAMTRGGQRTATTYGNIDQLTYAYPTNATLGDYSNKLNRVTDALTSTSYTSKDFKPRSGGNYSYDQNGNQTANADKNIASISYNHLNLPKAITFTGTIGRIEYDYDAGGRKLRQRVYTNQTLSTTTDYVGDHVYVKGVLDYVIHEEGRIAIESGTPVYEFFVKDHLGNVRQVLRPSELTNLRLATMEQGNGETEESEFSQIRESRQTEPRHNITEGGSEVAWLNAARGRDLGPSTNFEVYEGDSLDLSVHAKYERKTKRARASSLLPSGSGLPIPSDYGSMALTGGLSPLLLYNLAEILASDLKSEPEPEAYMGYALYDADSNLYEKGKILLSKRSENKHEELREKLYISKPGYIETYLVNETSEDVWFDNFRIESTPPLIVQETHYDPWGLELTGLGYQYVGIKVNKYLYNGKELIEDNGLQYYDYGARMYDASIGRFNRIDRYSEKYFGLSPYHYGANNPVKYIDVNGDSISVAGEHRQRFNQALSDVFGEKASNFSYTERGNLVYNGNSKKDFKGSQQKAFKGLNKVITSNDNISVQFADYHKDANGNTHDVVKDWGGGLYDAEQGTITISPNLTDVDVTTDNPMDILQGKTTKVTQNITAVLFHEIGEINEGPTSGLRGGVIDYENEIRGIIGLPKRPYDINHSYTVETIIGSLEKYKKK